MKALSLLAVLLVTCGSALAQTQTGATGTWQVDGVGAGLPLTIFLRADGPRLVGLASPCANELAEIYDGRIEGNNVTFKCRGGVDNSRMVTFKGTINGDELALEWELQIAEGGTPVATANRMFGPLAPRKVTAKRAADGYLAERFNLGRTVELASAVNLPQKNIKIEGLLFLPDSVRHVRAVIVAVGYGRGFDFYQDSQVRRLLDAAQSSLLLARPTNISSQINEGVKLNAAFGGDEALALLLQRFAQESGHPELATAPLLFFGHSGGGGFGSTFAVLHPQRTIALIGYQGSVLAPAQVDPLGQIPALFFADNGQAATALLGDGPFPAGPDWGFWRRGRSMSAPWTFAVQRDAPHGDLEYLKKADALTIPWISAVLRQRLAADGGPLHALTEASAWLGDNRTGVVAPFGSFVGSKPEATWLPDEATAHAWQAIRTSK